MDRELLPGFFGYACTKVALATELHLLTQRGEAYAADESRADSTVKWAGPPDKGGRSQRARTLRSGVVRFAAANSR